MSLIIGVDKCGQNGNGTKTAKYYINNDQSSYNL